MPSPFPGMNPYLEQSSLWHHFHERFLSRAADHINSQVGDEYVVVFGEHLYVVDEDDQPPTLLGHTDVAVGQSAQRGRAPAPKGQPSAFVKVHTSELLVERESYVEVIDRRKRDVITVIELLSPTNKLAGPERHNYLRKRQQLFRSQSHFVEIDLLRGGPRMPFKDLPPCDYYVMVSRPEDRPEHQVCPIQLRDPLPIVPIPLKSPHPNVFLHLQDLLHELYDAAGYEKLIYDDEPQQRLRGKDAKWANQLTPK